VSQVVCVAPLVQALHQELSNVFKVDAAPFHRLFFGIAEGQCSNSCLLLKRFTKLDL
jgi:hypothetical protein